MAIFQIFGHNPTNHEIHPFMPKTDKKLICKAQMMIQIYDFMIS